MHKITIRIDNAVVDIAKLAMQPQGYLEPPETRIDVLKELPEILDFLAEHSDRLEPYSRLLPLNWPNYLAREFLSWLARSVDPNDKLAPAASATPPSFRHTILSAYQVRFENQPDATAPAQKILVTDTLDPNLDLDTFELTEIAFADQRIAIPPGLDHYETTLPITGQRCQACSPTSRPALDRATRTFTLTLQAVDPATGWFPDDPLLGLLYPDDATGRGQGSVSYVVKPLAGLPSGTVIENRATIIFDYNDPIDTPLVHNTLDAGTPTSQVDPLPATTTDSTVHGLLVGPGRGRRLGHRQLRPLRLRRRRRVLPADLRPGPPRPRPPSRVLPGHTYAFYTLARDNVGHVESPASHARRHDDDPGHDHGQCRARSDGERRRRRWTSRCRLYLPGRCLAT